MFYLDRRGDSATAIAAAKYDPPPFNGEENFGWWSSHWKIAVSPGSRRDVDHRSSGSSPSTLSHFDSDESNSGDVFAQKPSADEGGETCEKIQLRTFAQDNLDIELIERDIGETDNWFASDKIDDDDEELNARDEWKPEEAVSSSPGRLIRRCQEYRTPGVAPSSCCSLRVKRAPEVEGCRTRLSCGLIDPERIGETQSRTSSEPSCRSVRYTETISDSKSTCDSLNLTWDNYNGSGTGLWSLEDILDRQSNDCSFDPQSDALDTPMCLCDELAIASNDRAVDHANNRATAINEVTSILEGLQNDPEKATVLLDEGDRFCDCRSSHDQLTRLALAIETDAEEESPVILGEPNNWLAQLRDKIERLQHGHKEIRGNVRGLRRDFQRDERKISDMMVDTAKLRNEIHELRYFDDLLTLIHGELVKIPRRSWPFVLGNSEPREEVNLIV